MKFSVLMSIYNKERSEYLELSLNSIITQTLLPNEVIIVKDGPLNKELDEVINNYETTYPGLFKIIALEKNSGLGIALNEGIKVCKTDIIVRMDSDDISMPDRFEKQITYLSLNEEISILGTGIEEFKEVPGDIKQYRQPPLTYENIIKFAKYRNPLNHPTVAFKRKAILAVGSYLDMPLFEDFYLWARVLKKGYIIQNLAQPLLYFRIGNDMIGRRHGLSYLKKEFNFLKAVKKLGFINTVQFVNSIIFKLPVRLLPKRVLMIVYKMLLR